MPTSKTPTIALVGRTNVGKSTLFNRLIEKRKALVSAIPGTTRDRQDAECIWKGHVIKVMDTGGINMKNPSDIEEGIIHQARIGMKESDLIVFVVDASVPLTDADRKLAKELERMKKPLIVIANKSDLAGAKARKTEPWQWSLGEPMFISATRGTGTGDLLDLVYDKLEEVGKPAADIVDAIATRITVIGRPNVGKSTLLNKILGQDRYITSEVAHTTREPNDTHIEHSGRDYVFVDTAGIRKKGKVRLGTSLERSSVNRSLATLRHADVTLFVIEASKTIEAQDKILAGEISDSGSGAIIVVNKWDLIEDKETNTIKEYEAYIRANLHSLKYAPILFVSAKTGQRAKNVFKIIDKVQRNRFTQLDQDELDTFLRRAMNKHKPVKGMGTAPPKILGLVQVETAPPRFALAIKSRRTKKLHKSYVRYLENQFRNQFGLEGTPIRVHVKAVQAGR